MRIHELKIDPAYYWSIKSGDKTFEVRLNDRDFRLWDYLALNEYDREKAEYTGEACLVQVRFVLDDPKYVQKGCVVLGIRRVEIVTPDCVEDSRDRLRMANEMIDILKSRK